MRFIASYAATFRRIARTAFAAGVCMVPALGLAADPPTTAAPAVTNDALPGGQTKGPRMSPHVRAMLQKEASAPANTTAPGVPSPYSTAHRPNTHRPGQPATKRAQLR